MGAAGRPRVFLAQLSQESGSFLPLETDLAFFQRHLLTEGEGLLEEARRRPLELAGALAAAAAHGVTVVPGLAAWAMPWGPVRADAYATLRHRLLDGLRAAQRAGPVAGVLLVLHGAMQVRGTDDAEGDLLGAVRREIGPATPLVASLDLHANVTRAMAAAADALVAYHTMPHTDMYETGGAAMRLLARAVAGAVRPVLAVRKLPLVTPAERHDHRHPPMAPLMARTLAPPAPLLSVSLCPVQPWLDVPELGWTVLAVADGDRAAAQRAADGLAAAAWEVREAFRVPKLTPADVARRAAGAAPGKPLVVSDSGDNTSGGAPGDSVHLLRGLLAARRAGGPAGSALLWLADAAAAAACARAGAGATLTLSLGSKVDARFGRPLPVRGRVERVVDPAHYVVRGPSWTGSRMDLGTAAVLTLTAAGDGALDPVGGPPLRVLVCARPVMDIDPGLYRCAGEHPEAYQLVQVRSPAGFRAAYEPLAGEVVSVESPGPTTSDLASLPWTRVPRPLAGIDADVPGFVLPGAPAPPAPPAPRAGH